MTESVWGVGITFVWSKKTSLCSFKNDKLKGDVQRTRVKLFQAEETRSTKDLSELILLIIRACCI